MKMTNMQGFMNSNKKIIYSVYMIIKVNFRNELKYKRDKVKAKVLNKELSKKRIKIEHVFAKLKNFRILQRLNHYKISKIEVFFNAIENIYNLTKT